ncbi:MAG: HlyD family efflux transporter periplasmic adaptor subunit [Candidatus Solibacter sp.]
MHTLRLTGNTVGEHSVTLRAPYLRGSRNRGGGSGDFHLVLKELVAQGSMVNEGDTVATFDREAMRQRLDTLSAEKAQAEARIRSLGAKLEADRQARLQQIRVAKAAVAIAQLDLKTAPVRSAIQAETFKLDLDEAKEAYKELLAQGPDFEASQRAQLRVAELELEESRLEEARALAGAERMSVRAPRSGMVVVRELTRNGQSDTIRAGDELRHGQPYLDIVVPGPMLVEARANQADVSHLHIGDWADVVPEAFPEIQMRAQIIAIGSMAVSEGWRASWVREVPVKLRIAHPDPRLLPSLTVIVDVALDHSEESTD